MSVEVDAEPAEPSFEEQFEVLRTDADMVAERARVQAYVDAEPDKKLAFIAEMDIGGPEGDEPVTYSCPMHPEVVSDEPDHCPACGMKLLPSHLIAEATGHDEHGDVDDPYTQDYGSYEHHGESHESHDHAAGDGIEWEDDMVEINRLTTPSNMRWKLIDQATGAENAGIDWRFRVGNRVKIRLLNEMAGDHPMHHPFHIHGAGRFLILACDGAVEPNLVWKDTALVRTGETVDILLDITNPGLWMAHCHIAENHESRMMFSFNVDAA